MTTLPDSAYQLCASCGEPVVPSSRDLYEVTGWEQEREQGGTNHLIARERTGRVVGWNCADDCAAKLKRGVPIGQGMLF